MFLNTKGALRKVEPKEKDIQAPQAGEITGGIDKGRRYEGTPEAPKKLDPSFIKSFGVKYGMGRSAAQSGAQKSSGTSSHKQTKYVKVGGQSPDAVRPDKSLTNLEEEPFLEWSYADVPVDDSDERRRSAAAIAALRGAKDPVIVGPNEEFLRTKRMREEDRKETSSHTAATMSEKKKQLEKIMARSAVEPPLPTESTRKPVANIHFRHLTKAMENLIPVMGTGNEDRQMKILEKVAIYEMSRRERNFSVLSGRWKINLLDSMNLISRCMDSNLPFDKRLKPAIAKFFNMAKAAEVTQYIGISPDIESIIRTARQFLLDLEEVLDTADRIEHTDPKSTGPWRKNKAIWDTLIEQLDKIIAIEGKDLKMEEDGDIRDQLFERFITDHPTLLVMLMKFQNQLLDLQYRVLRSESEVESTRPNFYNQIHEKLLSILKAKRALLNESDSIDSSDSSPFSAKLKAALNRIGNHPEFTERLKKIMEEFKDNDKSKLEPDSDDDDDDDDVLSKSVTNIISYPKLVAQLKLFYTNLLSIMDHLLGSFPYYVFYVDKDCDQQLIPELREISDVQLYNQTGRGSKKFEQKAVLNYIKTQLENCELCSLKFAIVDNLKKSITIESDSGEPNIGRLAEEKMIKIMKVFEVFRKIYSKGQHSDEIIRRCFKFLSLRNVKQGGQKDALIELWKLTDKEKKKEDEGESDEDEGEGEGEDEGDEDESEGEEGADDEEESEEEQEKDDKEDDADSGPMNRRAEISTYRLLPPSIKDLSESTPVDVTTLLKYESEKETKSDQPTLKLEDPLIRVSEKDEKSAVAGQFDSKNAINELGMIMAVAAEAGPQRLNNQEKLRLSIRNDLEYQTSRHSILSKGWIINLNALLQKLLRALKSSLPYKDRLEPVKFELLNYLEGFTKIDLPDTIQKNLRAVESFVNQIDQTTEVNQYDPYTESSRRQIKWIKSLPTLQGFFNSEDLEKEDSTYPDAMEQLIIHHPSAWNIWVKKLDILLNLCYLKIGNRNEWSPNDVKKIKKLQRKLASLQKDAHSYIEEHTQKGEHNVILSEKDDTPSPVSLVLLKMESIMDMKLLINAIEEWVKLKEERPQDDMTQKNRELRELCFKFLSNTDHLFGVFPYYRTVKKSRKCLFPDLFWDKLKTLSSSNIALLCVDHDDHQNATFIKSIKEAIIEEILESEESGRIKAVFYGELGFFFRSVSLIPITETKDPIDQINAYFESKAKLMKIDSKRLKQTLVSYFRILFKLYKYLPKAVSSDSYKDIEKSISKLLAPLIKKNDGEDEILKVAFNIGKDLGGITNGSTIERDKKIDSDHEEESDEEENGEENEEDGEENDEEENEGNEIEEATLAFLKKSFKRKAPLDSEPDGDGPPMAPPMDSDSPPMAPPIDDNTPPMVPPMDSDSQSGGPINIVIDSAFSPSEREKKGVKSQPYLIAKAPQKSIAFENKERTESLKQELELKELEDFGRQHLANAMKYNKRKNIPSSRWELSPDSQEPSKPAPSSRDSKRDDNLLSIVMTQPITLTMHRKPNIPPQRKASSRSLLRGTSSRSLVPPGKSTEEDDDDWSTEDNNGSQPPALFARKKLKSLRKLRSTARLIRSFKQAEKVTIQRIVTGQNPKVTAKVLIATLKFRKLIQKAKARRANLLQSEKNRISSSEYTENSFNLRDTGNRSMHIVRPRGTSNQGVDRVRTVDDLFKSQAPSPPSVSVSIEVRDREDRSAATGKRKTTPPSSLTKPSLEPPSSPHPIINKPTDIDIEKGKPIASQEKERATVIFTEIILSSGIIFLLYLYTYGFHYAYTTIASGNYFQKATVI